MDRKLQLQLQPQRPPDPTPLGTSFLAFYTPEKVAAGKTFEPAASATICTTSSSLPCSPTGTISITLPKVLGRYLIYQMNYQRSTVPGGPAGWYAPTASQNTLIGYYTVIQAPCTSAAHQAAAASYGPMQHINAAAAQAVADLAAMQTRLADSAQALATVAQWDETPPSLTIQNTFNSTDPVDVLWQGGALNSYSVCYRTNHLVNVDVKYAALLVAGSDTELVEVIQYNQPLIQGTPDMVGGPCFALRVKPGLTVYNNPFTIGLINSKTSATIARTPPFTLARASLTFVSGYSSPGFTFVSLNVNYRNLHPAAGTMDIARFFNQLNPTVEVAWCYTYCSAASGCCKTPPPPGTVAKSPSTNHQFRIQMPRLPLVQTTYTVRLYPGNSNVAFPGFVAEYSTVVPARK